MIRPPPSLLQGAESCRYTTAFVTPGRAEEEQRQDSLRGGLSVLLETWVNTARTLDGTDSMRDLYLNFG